MGMTTDGEKQYNKQKIEEIIDMNEKYIAWIEKNKEKVQEKCVAINEIDNQISEYVEKLSSEAQIKEKIRQAKNENEELEFSCRALDKKIQRANKDFFELREQNSIEYNLILEDIEKHSDLLRDEDQVIKADEKQSFNYVS